MSEKKIYFPNLDGLRTVAFLSVFFGHTAGLFERPEDNALVKFINHIIANADLGVSFFFVLSGFLISYLLLAEKNKYGSIKIKAFYFRRILRIWPVYFLVIIFAVLLSFIHHPYFSLSRINYPLLFTFLTNLDTCYNGIISSKPITVLWSVAVEEQFYLILPLLIIIFGKKVFKFFPVFVLLSLLFRLIYKDNIDFLEYHSLSVCGALFTGCFTAWLCLYKGLIDKIKKISRTSIIIFYILLSIVTVIRFFIFRASYIYPFMELVFPVLFAFVILEQNYSDVSFFKMKNFKLLTFAGKYTYGLYAYHLIFVCLMAIFYKNYFGIMNNYFIYFGYSFLCLIICYFFSRLSYDYIEKRFLKYKDTYFSR